MFCDFKRLNALRNLSSIIDQELKTSFVVGHFCSLARRYVEESSFYFKPFLFLSMLTSLRYSDIKNFPLSDFKNKKIFVLRQVKTGNDVKIDLSFLSDEFCCNISELDNFCSWISYHQISKEFFRLHVKLSRNSIFNFSSLTHFFRHLNATFFYQQKYPEKTIANLLGHSDLCSQKAYIHKSDLITSSFTN